MKLIYVLAISCCLISPLHADVLDKVLKNSLENQGCLKKDDYIDGWNTCFKIGNEFNGGDYRTDNISSPTQIYAASIASEPSSFYSRNCFCDKECGKYGDCCADVQKMDHDEGIVHKQQWKCAHLPGAMSFLSDYVYVYSKCSPDWKDESTRALCEFDGLAETHYLRHVPVLSVDSNITYRNVYCAVCNNDMKLKQWNVSILCDGTSNVQQYSEYFNQDTFSPITSRWTIDSENKQVVCSLKIQEMNDGFEYSRKYNTRSCKLAVDYCRKDWPDPEDAKLCKMYTFYLSTMDNDLVFKNYYCAKCNGYDWKDLYCFQILGSLKRIKGTALQLLFDFNLKSTARVGSLCGSNELFDPIRNRCSPLHCGSLYSIIDNKCVRNNVTETNNSLSSDCLKTSLFAREFTILPNKTVVVNATKKSYNPGEYELSDPLDPLASSLIICSEDHLVNFFKFSRALTIVSDVCNYISVVCLLLHIGCYLIVSKLRNLPGKNLLSLSVSLLVWQLLFLFGMESYETSSSLCEVLAVLMHLFILLYFLWMNVMAFDICRTFRSDSFHQSGGNRTFIKYLVYVSSVATSIIIIAVVVDNIEKVQVTFRPGYGQQICWMTQKLALFIFFAIPLIIIMTVNITMFVLTAWNIRKSDQASRKAIKRSSTVRYILYIKLAVIMGLTWILAIIGSFTESEVVWYISSIFNGLQGAFIFFAFSFKKKVFYLVKETLLGRRVTETTTTKKDAKTLTTNVNSNSSNTSNDKNKRGSNGALHETGAQGPAGLQTDAPVDTHV